jgi:hypothetical protein
MKNDDASRSGTPLAVVDRLEQIQSQRKAAVIEDVLVNPMEAEIILGGIDCVKPPHRGLLLQQPFREIYRELIAAVSTMERAEEELDRAMARARLRQVA